MICLHCKQLKALSGTRPPCCAKCITNGHKSGESIFDCPVCFPPQKTDAPVVRVKTPPKKAA